MNGRKEEGGEGRKKEERVRKRQWNKRTNDRKKVIEKKEMKKGTRGEREKEK